MRVNPDKTRARIRSVLDRYLDRSAYKEAVDFEVSAHHVHGEPISIAKVSNRQFQPVTIGDEWGAAWDTTWFKLVQNVPADWKGEAVVAVIDLGYRGHPGFGAEGLVYRDGEPFQGINPKHRHVRITDSARGGERVELLIEAAANPPPPRALTWPLMLPDPGGHPLFRLEQAELTVFDHGLFGFWIDFKVLTELMEELATEDPRAAAIRFALNDACNALDLGDVAGTYDQARKSLEEVLLVPAQPNAHRMTAVGHAHIDTAWLWPLRETVRKCARTFSTALNLMDRYPNFHFVCSQAQHYQWMKDFYPSLFARIKQKVKSGSWEPVGSMWVEADCNIPSGESLVRQILYGKRFFQQEFGYETKDVWLPDVFGYSAAMPQIMAQSGIEYFLTQKISWNDTNRFPHHTFYWEGIDGSRVFSHFPPSDTYNATFSIHEVLKASSDFKQHGHSGRSIYAYGFGDGGGGPTEEMIEIAEQLNDLEGCPRVEMGRAIEFFERSKAEARDLPVWSGELYLEYHRGTYTTQSKTKAANRKCELVLREAELWAAFSDRGDYPYGQFEAAWKKVLTNQFHDIIPGSSIHWVYQDAERSYAEVINEGEEIIHDHLARLARRIDTSNFQNPLVIFNSLSHVRREAVIIPSHFVKNNTAARGPEGLLPIQHLENGDGLIMATAPSVGFSVYDLITEEVPSQTWPKASERFLENEHLRVEWEDDGLISSIYDKTAERQVIPDGARANVFQIHPDYPVNWDAWDLDPYYSEQSTDIIQVESIKVVENGPVIGTVEIKRTFGSSSITQLMSLHAGSRRIDFHNEVDWQEQHRVLKVAFPVNIRSQRATYEIQFGHVERPTHENTSWDVARFEVCGHKWADLSESGYGVGLLNDCKYGYDIHGNVMRLTLLRAPTYPDPVADRGHHVFSYALFPHSGDLRENGLIAEGYSFNVPMRTIMTDQHVGEFGPQESLLLFDGEGVVLEAVKRLEDREGIAIRFFEAFGGTRRVRIGNRVGLEFQARLDLLERVTIPFAPTSELELLLKPFEIVTVEAVDTRGV